MTRRDLLQTVAGAAATAALTTAVSTPQTAFAAPASKIKRGVSLYSYQVAYFSGEASLEDLIAEASSIGAYGLEVIPDAVIPNYLNPSEKFVTQWHGWMEKYHTVPDSWCQSQDTKLIEGQTLTLSEGADRLGQDLKAANRLGFKTMRLLASTPLNVVEKCLPLAEKVGIAMNFEIHGPNRLDGPAVEEWVKLFEKTKSPYVGINPDMSLFEKRPVAVRRDCFIRAGVVREAVAKYIDQAQADGVPQQKAAAEVAKMSGNAYEGRYLENRYAGYQDPKKLVPLLRYAHHFHGKCYELTEDCRETSIPYEEIVPLIIEGGYQGYMATEFEGQRFQMDAFEVDEFDQVRRHQVLMKRCFGV
jgi:hypothetical protein